MSVSSFLKVLLKCLAHIFFYYIVRLLVSNLEKFFMVWTQSMSGFSFS